MFWIGKEDKITRFHQFADLVQPPLDPEQNSLKVTPLTVAQDGNAILVTLQRQRRVALDNPPARNGCSKDVKFVRFQAFPMHHSIVAKL